MVTGRWDHEGNEVTIQTQVVMTPKGGTVTRTWNAYLPHIYITSTMYPDMKDEKLFHVVIKSDLGQGRLNKEIIRMWQESGLYFKFGMPSGSSVNQE